MRLLRGMHLGLFPGGTWLHLGAGGMATAEAGPAGPQPQNPSPWVAKNGWRLAACCGALKGGGAAF
jgi:hypothetical protein